MAFQETDSQQTRTGWRSLSRNCGLENRIWLPGQYTEQLTLPGFKNTNTKDKRIKKVWYIYTMEYYSAIKKKEILPFATAWMELKMIILSIISQSEKDKYHMISLIRRIQWTNWTNKQNRDRLIDTESSLTTVRGEGGCKAGWKMWRD